uniref:TNFAIP3 interacting protein 3 n=1 Tax=Gopherus agassizii TaxID=38772 RepID=A0A452IJG5_9SAUR
QQIRILERQRQELLKVNKQWDQQFRSMKQHYEKKLAEVKAKLGASQRSISELEKERHQNQQECERLQKEKEILNEVFNELKEENKVLKEENNVLKEQKTSVSKKKEYYECEISRLNKEKGGKYSHLGRAVLPVRYLLLYNTDLAECKRELFFLVYLVFRFFYNYFTSAHRNCCPGYCQPHAFKN